MEKIILDLCGGTGAWSEPYKEAGYDVRLITLPDYDVRTYEPPDNVYGILAAPPCAMFCRAGMCRKRTVEQMIEAISIVDACLRIVYKCKPNFWALENPPGKLKNILPDPRFIFDPCDFGDGWTKRTWLWGDFKIPKYNKVPPTRGFVLHNILSQKVSDNQINKMIKYKYIPVNYKELYGDIRDRSTFRAITPPGFARAFFKANQ